MILAITAPVGPGFWEKLLLIALFVMFVVGLFGAVVWGVIKLSRRNCDQRGFEVKQTTGIEPVTKEKENDHG